MTRVLKNKIKAKALIFDMDGTLYRHTQLNSRYIHSIYQMVAHVKKTGLDEARQVFQQAFLKTKKRLKREPSKLFVLNQMGISDKDWARKFGARVAPDRWLKPDRKLRKVLLQLKPFFKLAVVTNNHKRNTMTTLNCLGVEDCFDEILTLSDTGIYKPSAKLYKLMSRKLNVDPEQTLSIGDRYDLDLAPAGSIGMQTLLVHTMQDIYRLPEALHPWLAECHKLTAVTQSDIISKCRSVIKKGRLVIMPTDTVYGLACEPALEPINWLYRAKGRQERNPVVLLISDPKQADRFVNLSGYARSLMKKYWPGALTLVLPAKTGTDWGKITRGGRMIGVRCPDHEFSRELIKKCGGALATTSANISGRQAPNTVKKVDDEISAFSDVMIDDGMKSAGLSSTVVKITGKKAVVLRKGPVLL